MRKNTVNTLRRRLLLGSLAAAAGLPLIKNNLISDAVAADIPHLSEDDATASALKYHNDAAAAPRVDKAGAAADQQFCHNCMFIKADSGQWRPCQIFPGKVVNESGWCSSWTQKS
jgi:High potential iron-sulfur protein